MQKIRKPPIKSIIDYKDNWSTPPDGKFYRLTQADIDAPAPVHRRLSYWQQARAWLDGAPGLVITAAVFVAFAVGMWALFAIWTAGQTVQTAIRG